MKTLLVGLSVFLATTASPASAQFGKLLDKIPSAVGGTSGASHAPIVYIGMATVEFLSASQVLAKAAGNAAHAAKLDQAIQTLKGPNGISKENLGIVDEAAAENDKLFAEAGQIEQIDRESIMKAAVHAGTATYLESKGIEAAKGNPSALANVNDSFILVTLAPKNLTAMTSLSSNLGKYFSAKGISTSDLDSQVKSRVASLEKG